jgi:hypothetical protein
MKRILEFKAFESLSGLSEDQKSWLDKCTKGSWSVGGDGKVNIEGNFDCSAQDFEDFKGVRFGRVSGGFYCQGNFLSTLEGSPQIVGDGFYCNSNDLKTLKGSPRLIGGDFFCQGNKLVTLEGSPEAVDGDFFCNSNPLETFEGAPETIVGMFYSDTIRIRAGRWGLSEWLEVLVNGTTEAQKLIATLISPEALNKRLKESPEKTMVVLRGVWNSPEFAKIRSQLKIPKGYEDEMDLLGDLDDIGL